MSGDGNALEIARMLGVPRGVAERLGGKEKSGEGKMMG